MGKRIVIALGGNALGSTPYEQLALVTETAKPIVDLIEQGNEVVIAHGNGPQVGMINLGMATAAEAGAIKSDMPFPECGAMSQGYIGYHLQNAIGNELAARGLQKDVATVVTQVLVDENDPAFQKPTKPVGAFYDKATAERIAAEKGYTMVEDAGRGYRQVVPSPKPVDVIEKNTVRALINGGCVVITVGGGGIPVVRRDGKLYGTPAVIDKDFASAKLAELVQADALVILGQAGTEEPCGNDRCGSGALLRGGAFRPRLHAAEGQGCRFVRQDRRAGHHRLARTGRSRRPWRGRYGRPSLISSVPFPGSKGPAA